MGVSSPGAGSISAKLVRFKSIEHPVIYGTDAIGSPTTQGGGVFSLTEMERLHF
jgi:hypothetical protein